MPPLQLACAYGSRGKSTVHNTKLASLEESFRGREKAGIKRVRGKQRIFFFFWK